MNKNILNIIIIFLMLITINYSFLDGQITKTFTDELIVTRIIDGDTIEIGNESIRLLGINAPEKKETFSKEATDYLSSLVLNKSVTIKSKGLDKYYRTLGYIFIKDKNINLELVKQGLANPYFPQGKDKYADEFYSAWENCKINLCEKSENKCIKIKSSTKNSVTLENICSNNISLNNYILKQEGRKKHILNQTISEFSEIKIELPFNFNQIQETIFLKDNTNKIVTTNFKS